MSEHSSVPPSLPPSEPPPRSEPVPASGTSDTLLTSAGGQQLRQPETVAYHPESRLEQAGRYHLLGEIGRGGMGAVLRGRDPELGRELALKVLLETSAGRADVVQRFREEAQIGGQLQHPGVVPVYELGRFDDGRPFFTMKLVQGVTFAKLLKERANPAQDRPRCLKIFEQICQAVGFAHSRGVIHRDLKPANVMVGDFGEVQVMDWGLAKVLGKTERTESPRIALVDTPTEVIGSRTASSSHETQEGDVMGTPSYMPPEQALGEIHRLDERCDVFSLGAILCEILTGQPPYVGANGLAVLHLARLGNLDDALARLAGCAADAELIELTKRCLESDLARRPRDAGEVAQAVVAYLAGVEERARQAELERAAAEVRAAGERRARKLTLGLATALLLLVVVGGGGAWLVQQQREAALARRQRLDDRATQLLAQARTLKESAWQAADERGLADSLTLAQRALDDELSAPLRAEVEALIRDIEGVAAQAQRNGKLVVDLLNVALPPEIEAPDQAQQPSANVLDKQYAAAFRAWGVEVDEQPVEELAARLSTAARPVLAQVVAGLEGWLRERLLQKGPEASRRKLLALADQLDPDPDRRQLRTLRVENRLSEQKQRLRERARKTDIHGETVLGVLALVNALIEVDELREAEMVLRTALLKRPGEVMFLNQMGRLLEEQQPPRYREAAECYRAARARDARLGTSLARALIQTNRNEEAESLTRELLAGQPDHPVLLIFLGLALRGQDKLEEAITAYRRSIAFNPNSSLAHGNLGNALLKQMKLEEARAAYEKAIALEPTFAAPHFNLGLALRLLDRPADAVRTLRKATALDPKFVLAHLHLGMTLADQKQHEEALTAFRQAIALNPRFARAHNSLGMSLWALGRDAEAMDAIQTACTLDPALWPAHYNLGLALRRQKKLAEAVTAFRKAVALPDVSGDAHFQLALTLQELGQAAEAEKSYRRGIALDPNNAVAHNNLGNSLQEQQKWTEAERAYQQAIALNPRYADAHFNLGLTLHYQRKLAAALAAYQQAIVIAPTFAAAHNNLGLVLRLQKKLPEAIAALRNAVRLAPREASYQTNLTETERWLVLDRLLPDLLAGKTKARSGKELVEVARFCESFHDRTHAAVGLFVESFRLDPKLLDDLREHHRYRAACTAALAAAGVGVDTDNLNATEKARLRQLALEWLQAELKAYRTLDDGTSLGRSRVAARLKVWQASTELTTIRESKHLDALPEKERQSWRELWTDVAALRKKVDSGTGAK